MHTHMHTHVCNLVLHIPPLGASHSSAKRASAKDPAMVVAQMPQQLQQTVLAKWTGKHLMNVSIIANGRDVARTHVGSRLGPSQCTKFNGN
jgi:hypothetical protein